MADEDGAIVLELEGVRGVESGECGWDSAEIVLVVEMGEMEFGTLWPRMGKGQCELRRWGWDWE